MVLPSGFEVDSIHDLSTQMKHLIYLFVACLVLSSPAIAQLSGNAVYGRDRRDGSPNSGALYLNDSTMLIEASVLTHVPADEYVAVYGLAEDATTVAEATEKIDARIKSFTDALRSLGVRSDDIAVDFITQTRTYDFETTAEMARERFVGFRVKKNVIVRYEKSEQLDKITLAAAKLSIFDLIKVDYIVRNTAAIRDRLLEAATGVIKQKKERYTRLLGLRLGDPQMIQTEDYSTYAPPTRYQSYTAAESGQVSSGGYGNDRYVVQQAQKSATFYYEAVDPTEFDVVLDKVPVEPAVQFALSLRVRVPVRR